jgi:hypothetical protein
LLSRRPGKSVRLGLGAVNQAPHHNAGRVVGRLIDGAKPQPPQSIKPADFLAWAKKQAALPKEVIVEKGGTH